MSEEPFEPPKDDVWSRKRRHAGRAEPIWVTYGLFLACIVMFVINMMRKSSMEGTEFEPLGWLNAFSVWQGSFWALLTTVFVHLEPFHLLFNLYWLWTLGVVLEKRIGGLGFLGFYLFAGFVSSAMQMWLGGSVPIGASGAVYGIFGFMWIARREVGAFGDVLGDKVWHIMLIWMFVCIPLSWSGVLPIANIAHFSGMAVGILGGAIHALPRFRKRAIGAAAALVLLTALSLCWAPWSPVWLYSKADAAFKSNQPEKAAGYLLRLKKIRR